MDTITIHGFTEAETKTGQNAGTAYLAVDSDKGRISCFDSNLFTKIKDAKGMEVEVEIKTNGDFKNLVAVGSIVGPGKEKKSGTGGNQYRTPEAIMRTDAYRYAVDMIVAGLVEKDKMDEVASNFYNKIKG